MCRAQLLVELFASCFDFCHYMCNSVVALFFEVLSCTACLIFRSQFLTFALFAFHMISLLGLAGFPQFPLSYFACCCDPGFWHTSFWQQQLVLWWWSSFLSFFLLGLVLACFGCKIGLLHQFVFARFDLFVCFLAVVCACPSLALLIYSFTSLFHTLTDSNYAY